jgi:nicotinamidase/pyrazinamidase
VQNTSGALFTPRLDSSKIQHIFTKGMHSEVDSYSGFYDNGHRYSTGLTAWLRERNITALDIAGVATDYCVKFTALDARSDGFQVRVLTQGCRGVNLNPDDTQKALAEMQAAGCELG